MERNYVTCPNCSTLVDEIDTYAHNTCSSECADEWAEKIDEDAREPEPDVNYDDVPQSVRDHLYADVD